MSDLHPLPPLRDRIRLGVRVLFVGINPGVRSALTGHHFAGFSNRFWKLLFEARLVPEPIGYEDDDRLPDWGFGITNIVARPTAGIDALEAGEYIEGCARLRRKVRRYKPEVVALVGITVFRALCPDVKGAVSPGLKQQRIGDARVFVLPNTSGRNANFSYQEMLAAFRSLARFCRARQRSLREQAAGDHRGSPASVSARSRTTSRPAATTAIRRSTISSGTMPRPSKGAPSGKR